MAGDKKPTTDQPLSLHGMSPEDAIKKAFQTPPKKADDCQVCGAKLLHIVVDGERGQSPAELRMHCKVIAADSGLLCLVHSSEDSCRNRTSRCGRKVQETRVESGESRAGGAVSLLPETR